PDLRSSFFLLDPAPTQIYTLSLHDALPISDELGRAHSERCRFKLEHRPVVGAEADRRLMHALVPDIAYDTALWPKPISQTMSPGDRKSTRLNSSHRTISYAVFCLKKNMTTT